jgi:hypothetical protein
MEANVEGIRSPLKSISVMPLLRLPTSGTFWLLHV